MIFDKNWVGKGNKQSLEHIKLIEEQGYILKTFPMEYEDVGNGVAKIKSFEPVLENKNLARVSDCWYALSDNESLNSTIAEEVKFPEQFIEGATLKISVNSYERNAKARAKCIDHYGCKCFICGFDFYESYGDIGKDYIHVHHEIPLSEIKGEYQVDPVKDLKPLCPNCHAIIHRTHPSLGVSELMKVIEIK